MDEFTSLSTGCFAVKPSKRRERLLEFPQLFCEESKNSLSERYDQYIFNKDKFKQAIRVTLDEVNKEIASDIVEFIDKGLKTPQNMGIPTLTLKIGVNFQEFSSIYELASNTVKEKLSIQCATIHSSQNSDITSVLKEVFNQLLSCDDEKSKVLVRTLSMKGLFAQAVECNDVNGIVFFIPRFDVLPSSVIEKLIEICSSINKKVRFFFVFGLSTGMELSTEWMSSFAISQLNIKTITLPSPSSLLEKVLFQSLLCSETPFKLSYRTFEVLLSRFSFSSYSIHETMKIIDVALLTHSMQQPLFKHLQNSSGELEFIANNLTDEEKALILQLPSVQKYVEKNAVSNKACALQVLKGNNDAIDKMFKECRENYLVLLHSFKLLHHLVKNIPGSNLVNKPLELYSLCLQGCVNEVKEVSVALKCFGMLQSTQFIERLKSAFEECQKIKDPGTKIMLLMRVVKMQIEEIEAVLSSISDDQSNSSHGKEKLKRIQMSFVSRLENFFSTLTAPTTWPLHEILWYSNHIELQNLLVGKCRTAIHRGLTCPNLYLQSGDKATKPDLCHLYDLFHEHGRLISLHDWIQSFNTMLGKKKISSETHAQFILAVSELQFMGYLKPTKRKTDHVAKLSLLGY